MNSFFKKQKKPVPASKDKHMWLIHFIGLPLPKADSWKKAYWNPADGFPAFPAGNLFSGFS